MTGVTGMIRMTTVNAWVDCDNKDDQDGQDDWQGLDDWNDQDDQDYWED